MSDSIIYMTLIRFCSVKHQDFGILYATLLRASFNSFTKICKPLNGLSVLNPGVYTHTHTHCVNPEIFVRGGRVGFQYY